MPTATEILRHEHDAVVKILGFAEDLADQLERGQRVSPDVLDKLPEFFRVFVDQCHHSEEEDLLFPLLEAKGVPRAGGPLGVMLSEHQEGRKWQAAAALVFTMDGVPLVYNGMEVGDATESGAPALFEKLPVFWQIGERRPGVLPFYKQVIALRRAHPALCQGETVWLHNSDETRVASYLRRGGQEEFLAAVNLSNRPFTGAVEVANPGSFHEVTPKAGIPSMGQGNPAGLPALSLESWGFRIFSARLVKTGGRLVKHARYYWLLLAEGHLHRRLFGQMLQRIYALPVPSA